MKLFHAFLPAAALLIAASTPSAQEITLFQNPNFSGPNFSANSSVTNLANVGFNDRASSATIRAGTWQLCSDDFFRGQCVTLQPGNYNNLGAMGLNNAVSSLREVGWHGGGGGGPGGPGGPGGVGGGGWNGAAGIVLYQWIELAGRSVSLNNNVNNLDDLRFNDRASSAVVSRGTWQICTDANFGGNCGTFPPGRYDNLGPLTGQASSVRLIGSGNIGGGQGGGWGSGGPGGARVMMYEGPNFSGRSYMVTTDVLSNLNSTGFNDRASSLRIEQGYWMFCTDANFGGDCKTLGPGDYASLPFGLANAISSARRISNNYPYTQPPRW